MTRRFGAVTWPFGAVTWPFEGVSLAMAESTSRPWLGPSAGVDQGLDGGGGGRAVVVGAGGGGGGEGRDGTVTICDTGDVSTVVARFGNSRAPIIN